MTVEDKRHGKYQNGKCNEDDPDDKSWSHYCVKDKSHVSPGNTPDVRLHRCKCGRRWRD